MRSFGLGGESADNFGEEGAARFSGGSREADDLRAGGQQCLAGQRIGIRSPIERGRGQRATEKGKAVHTRAEFRAERATGAGERE